jgi:hypothetical protein
MNRREVFNRMGLAALVWAGEGAAEPLPSSVAGVRIVDSGIVKVATELSQTVSPPYLFNHAMRAFLLGSLTGRVRGMKFDEELLYLACILHDLGLTERFSGEPPFEIQGRLGRPGQASVGRVANIHEGCPRPLRARLPICELLRSRRKVPVFGIVNDGTDGDHEGGCLKVCPSDIVLTQKDSRRDRCCAA